MRNPLNVAVIGLGVGEQHARTYHRLPDCRLRWLFDLDHARASALCEALDAGRVAEDENTVFTDPEVDIISIASFDHDHFNHVLKALQNRKHLFVEKPLCRNIDELAQIKRQWIESGTPSIESNLVLRAAPIYKWLKELIFSGDLGEIYSFDGDYLYGRLHKITEGWRKDVPDYSVMVGGGIHLIDLMIWLTGQRPVSVATTGNRICTTGTDFHHNDFMASTFVFDSGLVGRITANFGCVHRHQHVVRIFGSKATFILDDLGPRLHSSRDPKTQGQTLNHPTMPTTKGDLIPGFIENTKTEKNTHEDTQRHFDLISVCAAADKALTTDGPVGVQYA